MTKLLALETSGSVCSAAVSINGQLAASVEVLRPNIHDEALSEITQSVCRYADVAVQDLDIVAISSGPGSFTGLRIGAAFAKGLCYGGTPKLLDVPTTSSLIAASIEVGSLANAGNILCAIASHRDLVYVCTSPLPEIDLTPGVQLVTINEARALVTDKTVAVGPGAHLIAPAPISGLSRCSARFVAFAAWKLLERGSSFSDPATFVPNYHQEFRPR